jgi:hypothetical protein
MHPRLKTMSLQTISSRMHRRRFLETLVPERIISGLALLVVPAILNGRNLSAQTHAPQITIPAQQQEAVVQQRHRASAHAHADSIHREPTAEAIAMQPSASSTPISPADQPPNQAKLNWDRGSLKIEAFNSSLNQILRQVAAETGAKLEGFTQDQRVFGIYGPGPVSDVLSKLLEGSGYNVLMIGRRDAVAPVEIVLSARLPAGPQTATNNQNRSNLADSGRLEPKPQADNSSGPPRSHESQDPFNVGGPPRDSLEFMQEILDRQHNIDQQRDKQN